MVFFFFLSILSTSFSLRACVSRCPAPPSKQKRKTNNDSFLPHAGCCFSFLDACLFFSCVYVWRGAEKEREREERARVKCNQVSLSFLGLFSLSTKKKRSFPLSSSGARQHRARARARACVVRVRGSARARSPHAHTTHSHKTNSLPARVFVCVSLSFFFVFQRRAPALDTRALVSLTALSRAARAAAGPCDSARATRAPIWREVMTFSAPANTGSRRAP